MGKTLVAYDGSTGSKRALETAAALVDSELTIISVAPMTGRGRGPNVDPASNVEDHRAALAEASEWLAARGRTAETVEVVGHPAEAIVSAAEQGGFELVVMGSRGLSAVERFLVGSTASRVVAHAPCNVLVVR